MAGCGACPPPLPRSGRAPHIAPCASPDLCCTFPSGRGGSCALPPALRAYPVPARTMIDAPSVGPDGHRTALGGCGWSSGARQGDALSAGGRAQDPPLPAMDVQQTSSAAHSGHVSARPEPGRGGGQAPRPTTVGCFVKGRQCLCPQPQSPGAWRSGRLRPGPASRSCSRRRRSSGPSVLSSSGRKPRRA